MELNGEDVSAYEPSTSFIQLGKPPHTNRINIFTNLDLDAPVFPLCDPHITEPRSPNDLTSPGKDVSNSVDDDAPILPTNDEEGISDNLFDFTDQLQNPGCDPTLANTPFPDRLGSCIDYWKSINAPAYIIKALKEGIDIGLVPDIIEDLLPPNGINKRNMKWDNPDHLKAAQHLVRELTTRGIVGLRPTRARINLGIFLIIKPNGKYRFILNGRPLSPYLTKKNFNYELLQKFLDGGVSEWQFPRKT